MTSKLVRFGNYTFPTQQSSFTDNFRNAVPRTTRLAGMDGSFNEYGRFPPPIESGKVTISFTLVDYTLTGMTAKRDAVNALLQKGQQELFIETSNPSADKRFCYATINNISMPQRFDKYTDIFQPVTIDFQVEDPRWLAWPGAWYIGDDIVIGNSLIIGGARVTNTSVGNDTLITATNNGSAETPILMQFVATPGTATVIEASHLNEWGEIINRWRWEGSLQANETLAVDSSQLAVYHVDNGVKTAAFTPFTRLVGDGFIILRPGANSIRINGAFSSTVSLELDYYDAWR